MREECSYESATETPQPASYQLFTNPYAGFFFPVRSPSKYFCQPCAVVRCAASWLSTVGKSDMTHPDAPVHLGIQATKTVSYHGVGYIREAATLNDKAIPVGPQRKSICRTKSDALGLGMQPPLDDQFRSGGVQAALGIIVVGQKVNLRIGHRVRVAPDAIVTSPPT